MSAAATLPGDTAALRGVIDARTLYHACAGYVRGSATSSRPSRRSREVAALVEAALPLAESLLRLLARGLVRWLLRRVMSAGDYRRVMHAADAYALRRGAFAREFDLALLDDDPAAPAPPPRPKRARPTPARANPDRA